ncbi:MAG: sulfite exporter TauE/SafE family protein [Actinomycetota bacterium]
MSGVEVAVVLVAMLVAWTVKAVTGMGGPLIVVPVTSLFVDVETAVAVVAFPNLLSNLLLAVRERDHIAATRDLPTLAGFGVIGAIAGGFVFVHAPEGPLVALLVVAIVTYIVTFFAKPDLRVDPARSRRLAPVVGTVGGLFQGAIGISGPIVGSWIHSYRLPRSAHVLSVTTLFFITGVAQFTVIAANGELGGRVLVTLAACIPVFVSVPIGTRLRSRLNRRAFDLAIIGLLCFAIVALAAKTII